MSYYNNDKLIELDNEAMQLRARLAESQAREAKLRGALTDAVAHLAASVSAYDKFVGRANRKGQRDPLFSTRFSDFQKAEARCRETLLRLPHDDTTLREYVEVEIGRRMKEAGQYLTNDATRKAALAAERERCAKLCEDNLWLSPEARKESAIAIRNLGDE